MASLSPLSISTISHRARAPSASKRTAFLNARRLRFLVAGRRVPRLNRFLIRSLSRHILDGEIETERLNSKTREGLLEMVTLTDDSQNGSNIPLKLCSLSCGIALWLSSAQVAESSEGMGTNMVYEIGELFELGIQLSYLLILLALLGIGTFYVIRQVLVRRELDLSAKELQVYNALGVSYVRDNKLDKGIAQFETAVKLQPGYVTAWNNLGDAYEKRKDLRAALKAFEEVLLFDPNNKVARPRRDALKERVQMYKGVPIKSEDR